MKSAELFEKLKGMPEEAAKIQAKCKTADEVYEALTKLGLSDSKEQFLAAVKENIIASGVVSEEELDSALAAGDAMSQMMDSTEIGINFGVVSFFGDSLFFGNALLEKRKAKLK